MAAGYFESEEVAQEAVFTLSFRESPFGGAYAIACGLDPALDFLEHFRFAEDDLDYLSTLLDREQKPLFKPRFLDHLARLEFRCDVEAVDEGSIVFAHAPILRVRGPLLQAQLVETALLNIVNFQTLIATKAARVTQAAGDEPVLEFGLRRAQGIDGGLSASRAAYVGGCVATSNVLAGKAYGIPVAGTHAHSWVMSFEDEVTAFEAFASTMAGNCILLVDTYDTLEGVRNAVEVGRRLREQGHELLGIRLDSGDLARLSIEARRILDHAGFRETVIYASNELDEWAIERLRALGAKIGAWGVGTRLVTGGDQAALGGTFKLNAVRSEAGDWLPRIKVSEQTAKVSVPGVPQVRRFSRGGRFVGDMIYDERMPLPATTSMIDPADPGRRTTFTDDFEFEDLLRPALRRGRRARQADSLDAVRARVQEQLACLGADYKRFVTPDAYPVGLEEGLNTLRSRMIHDPRKGHR
ncbi:MAG: nicotinate phosphoribosyltransferase [Gemmatimonas sp.]|nr:nicotinate phosphoribosyltransferase [Gemmatimonas sp.]